MPRTSDPFKNINWQTAPPLHDLSISIGEHFSDARSGQALAQHELVEDCMLAFKALGIVPQNIISVMNAVYGLNNPAPKQPEQVANLAPPAMPVQPRPPEIVVPPEKKGGLFNR